MKCPYCNNEMQKGYVQCRDGLYWTPKKQSVSALAALAKGAVPIGNDDMLKRNKQAVAYKEPYIKKIIYNMYGLTFENTIRKCINFLLNIYNIVKL